MPGELMTTLNVWRDRGVAIVAPQASLYAYDARPLADALRQAEKLTQVGVVVLALESAVLVDADALDVVLMESRSYGLRGGRIVLAGVSGPTRALLELCGVAGHLTVFNGLEAALRELSPA